MKNKLRFPEKIGVQEWVEGEDIRVLAEGKREEKTDITYKRVMRRLEERAEVGRVFAQRQKETRRMKFLFIAGRNMGVCESPGCKNSIWTHTTMHWHHKIHPHTSFKRWISWYKSSPSEENLQAYKDEMEQCYLLCEMHHKEIHTQIAHAANSQEKNRQRIAEENLLQALVAAGVSAKGIKN